MFLCPLRTQMNQLLTHLMWCNPHFTHNWTGACSLPGRRDDSKKVSAEGSRNWNGHYIEQIGTNQVRVRKVLISTSTPKSMQRDEFDRYCTLTLWHVTCCSCCKLNVAGYVEPAVMFRLAVIFAHSHFLRERLYLVTLNWIISSLWIHGQLVI